MTKEEWEEIKSTYINYSWEFRFAYQNRIEINLCWSEDDNFPYHASARLLVKKVLFFKKWKILVEGNYATQHDLLNSFRIDGKTLDEIYEQLD